LVPDTDGPQEKAGGTPYELEVLRRRIAELEKVEENLRGSEEKYRLLADNANDIIWVADLDFKFTYVSPSAARVLGYTPEEALEQGLSGALTPASAEAVAQAVAGSLEAARAGKADQKGSLFLELELKRKDGTTLWTETVGRLLLGPGGEPAGITGVTRDISKRKKAERELKESEERYETLFRNSHLGVYRTTPDGRFLMANPALVQMLGYATFEELAARSLGEVGYEAGYPRADFKKRIDSDGEVRGYEAVWMRRDGSRIFVRENAKVARDDKGAIRFYEGTVEDVTERVIAEQVIRRDRDLLNRILETSPAGILMLNKQGNISYANPRAEEILGLTREDLFNLPFGGPSWSITDQDGNAVASGDMPFQKVMRSGQPLYDSRFTMRPPGRAKVHLSLNAAPLFDAAGKPDAVVFALEDVTGEVKSEEKLRSSLKEKEILLREVHHRVKNNLQIIYSLLNLGSRGIREGAELDALRECRNRIKSMSLLHETLYRSKDLTRIDFYNYVRKVVTELFQSFGVKADEVALRLEVEDVQMGIDAAIPAGMLITELVSNSLKHAFPAGRKGEICVQVTADESGLVTMVLADDGVGLPRWLDFRTSESLGMQLVNTLTDQLGGSIELNRAKGTQFTVRFHPDRPVREA
jgi:PAS domain S-box-containing protein